MRRVLFSLFLVVAAQVWANDYIWTPSGGDGVTFSSPMNWSDPTLSPPNPAGPPGSGDTADLGSSATVTAGNVSVSKLSGSGTSTLTLTGSFAAGTVETPLTLKGAGTLTAGDLTLAPVIDGGKLVANGWSANSLSVINGGSAAIQAALEPNGAQKSVNLFITTSSTLSVQGLANDLSGGIQSGGQMQLISLTNANDLGSTLAVSGAGSDLNVSGKVKFTNSVLDITSGASVEVGDGLVLIGGRNADGGFAQPSSRWFGNGTQVAITGLMTVGGKGGGSYTVALSDQVQVTAAAGANLATGADTAGTVTIKGAGTFWSIGGAGLGVASAGTGTLEISEGAKVLLSGKALAVAEEAKSKGTLTIDGTGSELDGSLCPGGLLASVAGSTADVSLTNGGALKLKNDLSVGQAGTARVTVFSGSSLTLGNATGRLGVGNLPKSEGSIIVSDAGSTLSGGLAIIGISGVGFVNVVHEAAAQVDALNIGALPKGKGTLTIDSGGTWTTTNNTFIGGLSPRPPGGTGTLIIGNNGTFRTRGIFVRPGGALRVKPNGKGAAGTGSFGPAGSFRVSQDGVFRGSGLVEGQLIIAQGATVSPGLSPGVLTVQGSYTQEAGSTLEIELGGSGAKSDLLKISGAATLGGKLKVKLVDGFNPKAAQALRILSAASVTGTFTEVEGAEVTYSATGVMVKPTLSPTTLNVSITPDNPAGGKVSTGFLGATPRTVGFTYNVTATPATGFVFAGWSGSVTATEPSLTFVTQENMTLVANFVPNPFASQFSGNYRGFLQAPAGTTSGGLATLLVGKLGSFSASVLLDGATYKFKGQFTGLGTYTRQLDFGGKLVEVSLTGQPGSSTTNAVTGTITVDGVAYPLTLDQSAFTRTVTTDRAGTYTLLFPAAEESTLLNPLPLGTGWASLKITLSGAVTLAGRLGDGTKLTTGGFLTKDGAFDFSAVLYGKLGAFSGSLQVAALPRSTDPSDSDVTGTTLWTKPAESRNAIFPDAFATAPTVLGSFFTIPPLGERLLPGLDDQGNASISFLGGNLEEEVTKAIRISDANVTTYASPISSADKLKLTFSPKSGTFAGTFVHPVAGQSTAFSGMVLRKQQIGGGYFLDATNSGAVQLTPP